MRKAVIAGVAAAVVVAGGGVYVASQYGWQILLHPAALLPRAPLHNAQTEKLEKDIAAAEAELKQREAAFAPVEAAAQARTARETKLNADILANQHGFFSGPDPVLKRLYSERDKLHRAMAAARWSYNLAKFKVVSKRKDIAELKVQLLSAQQGPGDITIPDMKQMLATRQAALTDYEDYVNVLGDLESQIFLKWYMVRDTLRQGPRFNGRARTEQAKHELDVLDGPHKQFDTALENAKKTLEQKRAEVAALKEALLTPEERRNRDAMRAMVMRGIAQGMANLPDPDYQNILPHNGTTCRTSSGTASIAPARIGSPCQINDGGFVSQGTVSSW